MVGADVVAAARSQACGGDAVQVIFELLDRSADVYTVDAFSAFSGAGVAVGQTRVR